MRIRSRLMTLVLATLLPAILAAVLGMVYVYRNAQEEGWQALRETTRALSRLLEQDMQSQVALLQTLAEQPAFASGDLKRMEEFIVGLSRAQRVNFYVVDARGRQVSNSTGDPSHGAPHMVAGLTDDSSGSGSQISSLYWSAALNGLAYALRVPVRHHEKLVYTLYAEVPVGRAQRLMDGQKLPAAWTGTILDRNNVIVARSRQAERFVGQTATGPLRQKLQVHSEGTSVGRTLTGEPVFAFFNRLEGPGWNFVVSVPQTDWREPALRAALLTGSVLALILGIGLVAAILVSQRVARPIDALRAAAKQLGRGEVVQASRSGITELDDVAAEIEQASLSIRGAEAELQRKVAQAVAETERTQRALLQAQKLEALGRLTGGIAHDFNNVLQTLTSGLYIARVEAPNERVRTTIGSCERAVKRGVELTRHLMAFGRIQEAQLMTVRLEQQIEQILPLLQGALPSHVKLELHLQPVWPVTLDPLQLELALLNLTINARDAMPEGGLLTMSLETRHLQAPPDGLAPGDYVELALVDTGSGMAEEVVARALDPFFTTKAVGAGSGLGLPQAYGFSRQSGGSLVLESTLGRGTRVRILLPRSQREASAIDEPRQPDKASDFPAGRMLFVEDDVDVREVVLAALEGRGFEVTVAHNGDEALRHLQSQRYDLLFSDVVMPGKVNGIALARHVLQTHPDTRVLLATGYTPDQIDLEGVRVLAKPYRISELMEALQQELQA